MDVIIPRYVSTGHILFIRMNSLYAVSFDVEQLEITGDAVAVVDDVHCFTTGNDGTLVYVRASTFASHRKLVRVDRRGRARPLTEKSYPFRYPSLSPDGQRLALEFRSQEDRDIWVYEMNRDVLTRITFEGYNTSGTWDPEGRRLAFGYARSNAQFNAYVKSAGGGGEAEQLTASSYNTGPTDWSSDGKTLILRQMRPGTAPDIGMLRLDGDGEPETLMGTRFREDSGTLSPDDRWLAFASDESGRFEIYVVSFPDVSRRWQISSDGGTEPLWSPNGRELFYRNEYKMMSVAIETDPDFTPGKPVLLFEETFDLDEGGWLRNYDVTPDGKEFIMIRAEGDAGPNQLEVIVNFFEELKRLAPNN